MNFLKTLAILAIPLVSGCNNSISEMYYHEFPPKPDPAYKNEKRIPIAQNVRFEMIPVKCVYGYGYEIDGELVCGKY